MSTEHDRSVPEWWELASQARVVKRGLRFEAVVGFILIALTAVVPYVVSVLSSIGAMRENSSTGLG